MSDTKEPTKKQIEHYMKHFYGYGSWKAKYWLVGLEEGTGTAEIIGNSKPEAVDIFKKKLSLLNEYLDNKELDQDCLPSLEPIKKIYPKYFKKKHLHPTLKKLVQVLFSLNSQDFDYSDSNKIKEEVRDFQVNHFGSTSKDVNNIPHCAIELLPFPSKNRHNTDVLDHYTKLFPEHFSSKKSYIKYCFDNSGADRLDFIKKKICNSSKKTIVFYEPEMFCKIKQITKTENKSWYHECCQLNENEDLCHIYWYFNKEKKLLFFVIEHPARQSRNAYWNKTCQMINDVITLNPLSQQ